MRQIADPAAAVGVTVSIVSHGNRELVLACLDSLLPELQGSRTVEIAVLDNASEDGSAEAIRSKFPNVRLLASRTRAGFGANHNTLARITTGKYLFLLNDDTIVRPGTVAALADFLESNPSVGVAAPRIYTAQGDPHTFVLSFPTLLQAARRGIWPWARLKRWEGREPKRVDWVNGCAMMVSRRAFEEANGFDEAFFMYAEEKDLCARLGRLGCQTYLGPGAAIVHIRAQSTGRVPHRR
jgi:N-acetylglucosaminyl-diphospho-decaprenol L-rhamnosyltransferase